MAKLSELKKEPSRHVARPYNPALRGLGRECHAFKPPEDSAKTNSCKVGAIRRTQNLGGRGFPVLAPVSSMFSDWP